MNEDDAKTKWYPFSRVIVANFHNGVGTPVADVHPHNRVQADDNAHNEATWHQVHNCIGSKCAAWREEKTFRPTHVGVTGTNENPEYGLGGEIRSTGYCGLAGKP